MGQMERYGSYFAVTVSLNGSETIRCERKTKELSKGTDLQCSARERS